MAEKFGKTWWGEHWLRALDNIDYSNRLPRGKTYANTGKVTAVTFRENLITAKVQGRYRSSYKVSVIIPPFFENDVEKLIREILERPMLISKLFNRELDPEILNIARETGLRVFPEQWTDLKMQCSCPDWAVPCKHIAAVIYMISREIDNNPFLVFEMHKVNLIEELKKRGVDLTKEKKLEIPKFEKLTKLKKRLKKETFDEESACLRIDLSKLHDITDTLIRILPDSPPFYPHGNFRDLYRKHIAGTVRKAGKHLSKNLPFVEKTAGKLTKRSRISIITDKNGSFYVDGENHTIESPLNLIDALLKLKPEMLPDYNPSVAVLRTFTEISLHLLSNGAVTPMIFQRDDNFYEIRWIPAMIDSPVRNLLKKCSALPTNGLVFLEKTLKTKKSLTEVVVEPVDIISFFLTKLINEISPGVSGDLFLDMFFKAYSYNFKGVGEENFSGGIKVWLDRHHIHNEFFKPVMVISELKYDKFGVSLHVEQPGIDLPATLKDIFEKDEFSAKRFQILKTFSLVSPFVEGLDAYINSKTEIPIEFDMVRFGTFITEMLPVIKLMDIKVVMPKSLQHIFRPKPTIKVKKNSSAEGTSFFNITDMLNFDWQVAMGSHIVSKEEFDVISKKAQGLVKFKGTYLYVNENDLVKITRHFEKSRPLKPMEILRTAIVGEYEGAPVLLSEEVRQAISEIISWSNQKIPKKITATLRPYQQRGYSWLYNNSKIGFGSIIADDMGLGKTLQVITFFQKLKDDQLISDRHRCLVVVPTGLLFNWQKEIEKFAPDLTAEIYHGPGRDMKTWKSEIILTTYGVIRSDAAKLGKKEWLVAVIDEAQHIKNSKTAQAKAVKSIPAKTRIAMSGTPVENKLLEFWSIMDFVNKDYLGNTKNFNETFAFPIQNHNDEEAVIKFKKATTPFLLRRLKTDKSIISDLPEKIEINQYATLTKEQAALYEKTVSEALETIGGIKDVDRKSLFARQGLVLQMILALKQICNHPAQFLKTGLKDASLSGKAELLNDILGIVTESHEKALIFTQFREMGTILSQILEEKFGEKPLFYHGGCTIKHRQEMVERFQTNRGDRLFILSLKAAGTGLNLTAANHVIHYDLWWNPAVETQATDRAYRIGQKKNVEVHRFITRNTFEEKIDKMIQSKKHLAEMTVATGENWIGSLSNSELNEIFRL